MASAIWNSPGSFQYGALLKLLESQKINNSAYILLEIYLVVNDIRPAALLEFPTETIADIFKLLYRFNLHMMHFKKNLFFVIHRRILTAAEKERFVALKEAPDSHKEIGKILGYITPIDITDRKNIADEISANVVVEGLSYYGEPYTVHLAAQRIKGKKEEEIAAYFAPILEAVQNLKNYTSAIQVDSVALNIEPYQSLLQREKRACERTDT